MNETDHQRYRKIQSEQTKAMMRLRKISNRLSPPLVKTYRTPAFRCAADCNSGFKVLTLPYPPPGPMTCPSRAGGGIF